MPTPLPLIDLSGPPRERGRQYGAAAAGRIHRSAEIYLTAFEKQRLGAHRVRALVDTLIPIIERFEPAYLDEMRGIAEGAHCPLDHVVVVNARTELLAQARLTAAEPDGCTGAVVLPEASSGGVVLHGQNWDWRAECADTGLATTPDSAYRAQRVRGLLAPKRGRLGIEDLKAALFDDFGSPYSVCRPPRPAASGNNLSASVMMIVMQPAEGWMEICPLPALHREFTRYTLSSASSATPHDAEKAPWPIDPSSW